jgi:hypothetical protein
VPCRSILNFKNYKFTGILLYFALQHTVLLLLNQWGNKFPLLSWIGLRRISQKGMVAGKLLLLRLTTSTESSVMYNQGLEISDYIVVPLKTICTFCRLKLKEHMQYCVDHPEEVSKLAKVKAQVSEVKGVMMENIEKACFMDWSSYTI